MQSGVKPVYIFDGKPPTLKGGELAKRLARRNKAEEELKAAQATDNVEDIDKFSKRLVRVTRQHNEDCKHLLKLMGVPYVEAPCEAEAQCAELAKKGKVYATATDDMDALTFATPKLLKRFTFSTGAKTKTGEKVTILEIDFKLMLSGLGLTYDQFVDLCILCGCDYCSSIKGIGPKTALKLIKEHNNLEGIVEFLRKSKNKAQVPPEWRSQKVSKKVADELEKEIKAKEERIRIEKEIQLAQEAAAVTSSSSSSSSSSEVNTESVNKLENKENAVPETTTTNEDDATNEAKVDEIKKEDGGDVNDEDNDDDDDAVIIPDEEEKADVDELDLDLNGDDMEEEEENVEDLVEGEYVIIPPIYEEARGLFVRAEVRPAEEIELKWNDPDVAGLTEFLVNKMGFNPDRVNNGIKRLQEAQKKKSQMRMDSFFAPTGTIGQKRKVEEPKKGKGGAAAKKQAGGGKPRR